MILSVLPVHYTVSGKSATTFLPLTYTVYKCHKIFYQNVHNDLISSRILKTGDIRWPRTASTKHWHIPKCEVNNKQFSLTKIFY